MLHTPSGGAGHGAAATDSGLMSIGTVLNVLPTSFPKSPFPKIRFLESEGLIEPQRTPSGYRKFSARDVERLGHVLRMQRDHHPPLKAIREHLEAMERGEAVPLPTVGRQRDRDPAPESFEGPPTAARVGREELLAAAGVDEEELRQWESYGLVTPLEDGAYEAEAVTVAALVAELGRFGIEPRHLRVMKRRRPRGRARGPGGGPAEAAPEPADQGLCGGPHQGAGGAHGEAARRAGADGARGAAAMSRPDVWGPDQAPDPGPTTQTSRARPRVLCERARCLGVRVEMPSNQPIVLLREVGGDRYLPIWIGRGRATAIAFAQQGMAPARPLTHDLFKDVLEAVGQELTEVRITDLRRGRLLRGAGLRQRRRGERPPVRRHSAGPAHRDADLRE
ncbi:hypothetical protein SPURM210S_01933 [Streptomyces purpurascens]